MGCETEITSWDEDSWQQEARWFRSYLSCKQIGTAKRAGWLDQAGIWIIRRPDRGNLTSNFNGEISVIGSPDCYASYALSKRSARKSSSKAANHLWRVLPISNADPRIENFRKGWKERLSHWLWCSAVKSFHPDTAFRIDCCSKASHQRDLSWPQKSATYAATAARRCR